jgi:hypothetical protein
MSMHPIEHLVYFSAIFLMFLVPTPFWVTSIMSLALVVYPIPAHIGFFPFEVLLSSLKLVEATKS